jgi:hypothetical protein
MGWSIYYRIRSNRAWTDADRRRLLEHEGDWCDRLSVLSEPYTVRDIAMKPDYHGATKPAPSPRAANDYAVIIQALRELGGLFPDIEITVGDDSGINRQTPLTEVDLEATREAMREDWGDDGSYADEPEGEYEDEQERADLYLLDEEGLAQRSAWHQAAVARAQPLLDQAARDFEIWKQAQQKKG